MLVKLRISNEKDFMEFYKYGELHAEHCFIKLYSLFIKDFEDLNIPSFLSIKLTDERTLYFDFNGLDKRTNTYFYEFSTNS
jgi:hypothetical protein